MKINLLRTVRIDGKDHEPGEIEIEDGYAQPILSAGWGTEVKAKRPKDTSKADGEPNEADASEDEQGESDSSDSEPKPKSKPTPRGKKAAT